MPTPAGIHRAPSGATLYPAGSPLPDWTLQIGTLRLGPGTPYRVYTVEGLGIADVRTSDVPRPNRHGDFMGAQDTISSKSLQITIDVTGTDPTDTIANLDYLTGSWYTREGEDVRPLSIKLPGRAEAVILGRPRRASVQDGLATLKVRRIRVVLEYYAPDPVFYAAAQSSASVSLNFTPSGITFPLRFPLSFGGGRGNVASVENVGNFDVPAVIAFYAVTEPLVNPTVEHLEQGRRIALNYTIPPGQFVEVDTDARTVRLQGTASRRHAMSGKWFDLNGGTNTLRFGADSASSGAYMLVSWRSGVIG